MSLRTELLPLAICSGVKTRFSGAVAAGLTAGETVRRIDVTTYTHFVPKMLTGSLWDERLYKLVAN